MNFVTAVAPLQFTHPRPAMQGLGSVALGTESSAPAGRRCHYALKTCYARLEQRGAGNRRFRTGWSQPCLWQGSDCYSAVRRLLSLQCGGCVRNRWAKGTLRFAAELIRGSLEKRKSICLKPDADALKSHHRPVWNLRDIRIIRGITQAYMIPSMPHVCISITEKKRLQW